MDKLVNLKPNFKLKSATQPNTKEIKPHVVQYFYRLYIVSKIIEGYCYNLKGVLPSKYIENKVQEIVKACQNFYRQLDKALPKTEFEVIEDEMYDYFVAVDDLMALKPEDRKEMMQLIAERKNQRIADGELFEVKL